MNPNEELKQSVIDAWRLKMAINKALLAFRGAYDGKSKESEVTFRYQAIDGILTIAIQDATTMAMEWEKDLGERIKFIEKVIECPKHSKE